MNLLRGDCVEQLRSLASNSVDSLVTDPPAGISFMGKEWDHHKGGRNEWIKWMTEVMTEAMRVMKPGAHGLVWALPRTSHWTATALEDAGFEVRDVVNHIFGTGFPKSLDISKAIDKAAGAERENIGKKPYTSNKTIQGNSYGAHKPTERIQEYITAPQTSEAKQWSGWGTALKPSVENWLLIRKKLKPIDEMWYEVHTSGVNLCQFLFSASTVPASLKLSLNASDAVLNTVQWNVEESINTLADLHDLMVTLPSESLTNSSWNIVSLWSSILVASFQGANMFTIEMASSLTTELKTLNCYLSKTTQESTIQDAMNQNGVESNVSNVEAILKSALIKFNCIQNITAPKIAIRTNCDSSHIILIRKPCSEKTVAANVLKHGTGGINIDECRVEGEKRDPGFTKEFYEKQTGVQFHGFCDGIAQDQAKHQEIMSKGRFPANLILDEAAAEILDEQVAGKLHAAGNKKPAVMNKSIWESGKGFESEVNFRDFDGGASRFFYVAKASKADRNAGLEGMPEKNSSKMGAGIQSNVGNGVPGKTSSEDRKSANHHPTVKNTKLMEYLITLVTPPGGTVLDPFMGSGSTGVAAKKLGFDFVGIEKEQEYFEIARKRIMP